MSLLTILGFLPLNAPPLIPSGGVQRVLFSQIPAYFPPQFEQMASTTPPGNLRPKHLHKRLLHLALNHLPAEGGSLGGGVQNKLVVDRGHRLGSEQTRRVRMIATLLKKR